MKSNTRRLVEHLLDPSLNHTEAGHLTGRDRSTISKLRMRLAAKKIDADDVAHMSDLQLAEALRSERATPQRRVHPDWDEMLRHVVETGCDISECHQHYLSTYAEAEQDQLLSYSQFARLLGAHRKRRAPEYRHHYAPGDVLQIDFTGLRPAYHDAQTGRVLCTVLLAVLPYSQLYLATAIPSEKRPDVIHGLIETFARLGGTPRRLIFDNFKAAVDRARTKKQAAKINPEFLAMLDYYEIKADPARAGEPKDKGAVEAGVRLLQRYIARKLKHAAPRSLAEMDAIVQEAVTAINKRAMRALKTSRLERFEQRERGALRRLPDRPYEYGEWLVGRKVPADYHVHHGGVAYSVPFELIGRGINMKITSNSIEIFYESKLVAIHLKPTDGQERVTNPDHMPEAHRAIHQKDSNALIARAATHSQSFGAFIAGHLQQHKNPPGTFAMLEKLIKLRAAYGGELFDKACFAAVRRKQFASAVLQELLVVGLRRPRRTDRLMPSPKPSGNIRGARYYEEDDKDAV